MDPDMDYSESGVPNTSRFSPESDSAPACGVFLHGYGLGEWQRTGGLPQTFGPQRVRHRGGGKPQSRPHNAKGAFASCWFGVPALAGEGQDWQANGQGGGAPDRLKPGLRTSNSRMRPNAKSAENGGLHCAQ